MDISSLMWDEATRDADAERLELARTAALADADRLIGPLVFQAANDVDLVHRLALAEPHLLAISSLRGYPAEQLEGDLKRRWQILSEARTVQAQAQAVREEQESARREVTAAREAAMDADVARLAALAARDNPAVPMAECLRLASEAVRKRADAYPLAYESWGGTADGPVTDRVKNWKPPGMGGNSGGSGPGGPEPAPRATPPKLDDELDAPFRAAQEELRPRWDAVTSASREAAWDWSKPFRDAGDALRRRWNRTTGDPELHQSESDWAEDTKRWHENLDQAQHEMNQRWDANAAAPGASPAHHSPPTPSSDLLSGFDQVKDEMDKKWDANAAAPGASPHHRPPVPPAHFSDADRSGSAYQDTLPTDPNPHFSHPDTGHRPAPGSSGPVPTHFSG